LVNILCIWGLFGNVITVIVLIKQQIKGTITILLTSIAVFDIVFCVTQLLQEAIIILKEYDPVAGGKFLIIYMHGIVQWNHLALSSSIYSVAIIGVERLIAVCFPFLVARICTPYRTKCLIVLTEVFIFTFTFPEKFLFYEFKWQNNQTVYTARSWARSANTHLMFYWVYIMPLVQVILPLCVLTACYTVIVVMLRSSSSKTSKLTPSYAKTSKAKELKMFRLLLALMTFALLSFSPSVIFSLTLSYGVLYVDLDHYSFELVKILTKVCCHVFTSVNFILYVTMCSKFAKSYSELMKCCLPGQRRNSAKCNVYSKNVLGK
ncbi:unnamed protein product, partial [Lymnaea stagnalis]